ncbi:uncharacterized protein [Clytia hemisphaerica]|uniref:Fibrinogen C-terminal domain-containing protein n=1 Tax=Clytia hemisphaerica TaxID=252671 RepID=A0A7M5WX41_9CNID
MFEKLNIIFPVSYLAIIFSSIATLYCYQSSRVIHKPEGTKISVNISYIRVKYMTGHRMVDPPIKALTTNDKEGCVKECLLTSGKCQSMNLKLTLSGFDCEILQTDIYTSNNLTADVGSIHVVIVNGCSKDPCQREENCVPNYQDDSYACVNINARTCKEMKDRKPLATSGYYKINLNGKMRDVYCDMDTDHGGWMMLANYTNKFASSTATEMTIGDLDSFLQLQNGDFLLDGDTIFRKFILKLQSQKSGFIVTSQTLEEQ